MAYQRFRLQLWLHVAKDVKSHIGGDSAGHTFGSASVATDYLRPEDDPAEADDQTQTAADSVGEQTDGAATSGAEDDGAAEESDSPTARSSPPEPAPVAIPQRSASYRRSFPSLPAVAEQPAESAATPVAEPAAAPPAPPETAVLAETQLDRFRSFTSLEMVPGHARTSESSERQGGGQSSSDWSV